MAPQPRQVTYSSSLMTVGYTTDWEEHFGQAKSSAMKFRNGAGLCDRSCKGLILQGGKPAGCSNVPM
jgi:hypothetical protein